MIYKTFVINMKKSPDRLDFMSKQLADLGIDFVVQEGVDGKNFDFTGLYDEKLAIKSNGVPLAPVEKGCALSHRLIWERIISENLDYGLILEDDVELPSNFGIILNEELHKRKTGETKWEFLSFNYPSPGTKFIQLWLYLITEKIRRGKSLKSLFNAPVYFLKFIFILLMSTFEGVRDFIYRKIFKRGKTALFYRSVYLAGCYIISKKGAEKLLSINKNIIYAADRIQNIARTKRKLNISWYIPLIVRQRRDKFKSTMFDYSKSKKNISIANTTKANTHPMTAHNVVVLLDTFLFLRNRRRI